MRSNPHWTERMEGRSSGVEPGESAQGMIPCRRLFYLRVNPAACTLALSDIPSGYDGGQTLWSLRGWDNPVLRCILERRLT